jgi:hypothetical protein
VDESAVQFALPNAAHRDRCADMASVVEAALSAHFQVPVTLALIVDDGRTGAADVVTPTVPDSPTPGGTVHEDGGIDDVDIEEFEMEPSAHTDQASAAEARLLEAFPGTSEVTN